MNGESKAFWYGFLVGAIFFGLLACVFTAMVLTEINCECLI